MRMPSRLIVTLTNAASMLIMLSLSLAQAQASAMHLFASMLLSLRNLQLHITAPRITAA